MSNLDLRLQGDQWLRNQRVKLEGQELELKTQRQAVMAEQYRREKGQSKAPLTGDLTGHSTQVLKHWLSWHRDKQTSDWISQRVEVTAELKRRENEPRPKPVVEPAQISIAVVHTVSSVSISKSAGPFNTPGAAKAFMDYMLEEKK